MESICRRDATVRRSYADGLRDPIIGDPHQSDLTYTYRTRRAHAQANGYWCRIRLAATVRHSTVAQLHVDLNPAYHPRAWPGATDLHPHNAAVLCRQTTLPLLLIHRRIRPAARIRLSASRTAARGLFTQARHPGVRTGAPVPHLPHALERTFLTARLASCLIALSGRESLMPWELVVVAPTATRAEPLTLGAIPSWLPRGQV